MSDGSSSMTTTTKNSSTGNKSAISGSSTAIDLVEITGRGENLPSGWSEHKHAVTGQVMYINQSEMIYYSSRIGAIVLISALILNKL
jgi:hypothetical protein